MDLSSVDGSRDDFECGTSTRNSAYNNRRCRVRGGFAHVNPGHSQLCMNDDNDDTELVCPSEEVSMSRDETDRKVCFL